ncbi:cation transporter [Pareuzebyella sediminis]|nr:cation transporter [Pareuzebyella sediminis]
MKKTIIIRNLKCRGCATSITTKLAALPNITSLEID